MIDQTMQKTIKSAIGAMTLLIMLLSAFVVIKIATSLNVVDENNYNTITVEGDSEIFATPDIATISFSATNTNKDLKTAQAEVEKNSSLAVEAVKKLGVDDKDIQTTYYNANPQYDYKCGAYGCAYGNGTLIGYQVVQTTTVKVRDLSKVGAILGAVGNAKVSDIQGPNFDIENKDDLRQQAREEAIKEAKEKAKVLAKDLGVRLGKIVSYYDSGYGGPIMYAKSEMSVGMGGDSAMPPAPTISEGQNRIYSNVSIVYKIK